ncbi:MAG: hypothetical protein Q9191_001898 [Dirinaria sp. TL-2023a]
MVPCEASENCGILYPRGSGPSGSGVAGSTATGSSGAQSTGSVGPQSRYLIIPKTGSSKKDTDNVSADLKKMVKGKNTIYSKSDDSLGVLFWTANISPSDADRLKKSHTILLSVKADKIIRIQDQPDHPDPSNNATKRTISAANRVERHLKRAPEDNLIRQSNALPQLKVVSQPSKEDKVDDLKNFVYRKEAGKGVTVYIFDDGANKEHNEWKNQPGNKRWIHAGDPNDDRYVVSGTEDDQAVDGHGTCVYSMAVGPKYGIAKEADVVIVKHAKLKKQPKDDGGKNGDGSDSSSDDEEDTLESATLDGMAKILEDIKEKKLQKKAVVNLSWGVSAQLEEASKTKLHDIIKELLENDVVVVTASGNEADDENHKEIDDYPALFRKDLKDLIVVGAVDNNGKTWSDSQGGDLLDLSAPGVDIICADGKKNIPQKQSGTSFSTASVSGLAAYFLSLPELKDELQVEGKTAEKVKEHILKLAYPRIDGEVKVLYNGEKSDLKTDKA